MAEQTAVTRRPIAVRRAGRLAKPIILCILVLSFGGPQGFARADGAGTSRVRAPDFTGADASWNTDRSSSLKALRGQVAPVGFETRDCIDSMRAFTGVDHLEKQCYDQAVTVVRVHSADVFADNPDNRCFTSDADHKYVLRVDLAGNVRQAVGAGQIGWQEGRLSRRGSIDCKGPR